MVVWFGLAVVRISTFAEASADRSAGKAPRTTPYFNGIGGLEHNLIVWEGRFPARLAKIFFGSGFSAGWSRIEPAPENCQGGPNARSAISGMARSLEVRNASGINPHFPLVFRPATFVRIFSE
jgi:hypothetical protein